MVTQKTSSSHPWRANERVENGELKSGVLKSENIEHINARY
jgi:hypothetical protein